MAKRNRTFASINRAELLRALMSTERPTPQPIADANQIDIEDLMADAIIIRKAKPTAETSSADPKAN